MMKIEEQKFVIDATIQLQKLAEELGVKVDVKQNGSGFMLQFKQSEREAQIEFQMYAGKFGYDPSWFGKLFMSGGKTYRISGVKPTAEKNCLIINRTTDNREFVCSPAYINEVF
jgi:hypothetical protein